MNDPRLEIAIERALRAEAEYKRLAEANRAHNERMLIVTFGVALLIFIVGGVLVVLWLTL